LTIWNLLPMRITLWCVKRGKFWDSTTNKEAFSRQL
jgi:hypothetical protein